jgi:hypothetical protein
LVALSGDCINNHGKAWAYSYLQFLLAPAGIAVQLHQTPLHGCELARQSANDS